LIDPSHIEPASVEANGKTVYAKWKMGHLLALMVACQFMLAGIAAFNDWNQYERMEKNNTSMNKKLVRVVEKCEAARSAAQQAKDAISSAVQNQRETNSRIDRELDSIRARERQGKRSPATPAEDKFGDVPGDEAPTGLYIRVPFGWGIA
jgi:hypothetical protein